MTQTLFNIYVIRTHFDDAPSFSSSHETHLYAMLFTYVGIGSNRYNREGSIDEMINVASAKKLCVDIKLRSCNMSLLYYNCVYYYRCVAHELRCSLDSTPCLVPFLSVSPSQQFHVDTLWIRCESIVDSLENLSADERTSWTRIKSTEESWEER